MIIFFSLIFLALPAVYAEDSSVETLLSKYLQAHSEKNTELLEECFHPKAHIAYVTIAGKISTPTLPGFLHLHRSIFRDAGEIIETFKNTEIEIYQGMAHVSTDYVYSIDGKEQEGRDYFVLVREKDEWVIMSLMYTLKFEEPEYIREARRKRMTRIRAERMKKLNSQ